MSAASIVKLCITRESVAACWNNAGTLTDVTIHYAYDGNGVVIPPGTTGSDGTTNIGTVITDTLGNPVEGVDPTDIKAGRCGIKCHTCLDNPCLDGSGVSTEGRIKGDINPGSLSQGTLENSYWQVTTPAECPDLNIPITGPLTIVAADNGDPTIQNFVDAFNSIGGVYSARALGIDDGGTNSVFCVTVPQGLGNISVSLITQGGSAWEITWDDFVGEWNGIDDVGNTTSGSATNC